MINSFKLDSDFFWKVCLFFIVAGLIFAFSDIALAVKDTSTEIDPLGGKLCSLVEKLTGNVAKAIATVAILGVAGGLLLGKLNWVSAMTVAVGVIVIFSAGQMVAWISGNPDGSNCETSTGS